VSACWQLEAVDEQFVEFAGSDLEGLDAEEPQPGA
jgi:hypothetical protein